MSQGLKISVSGVRGIVGDAMNPEVALGFSRAFGRVLGSGKVVVARDTRQSGEALSRSAIAGLLGAGLDVVDIGIAPTPAALFARKMLDAAGALIVTASHNTSEWNALKFVGPDGTFLHGELHDRLLERYREENFVWNTWDAQGVYSAMDGTTPHTAAILSLPLIDVEGLRKRKFRVVIDAVNGAGGEPARRLLTLLGCEVVPLYCEKTGRFPRNPEPVRPHLGELEACVREHRADIGFALDPDADRLAVVDERGNARGEEMTLPLAVDLVLSHEKGSVVVNLSTSMTAEDIAREHGVPFYRTPVGEANVALKMREEGAIVGGEGNGGVMYPGLHAARDGLCGMALVLECMLEKARPVGEILDAYPAYTIEKRKVAIREGLAESLLLVLAEEAAGATCEDGLRIEGKNFWVHLRPSNTEPVMRIIAEAKTPEEARRLGEHYEEKIIEILKGRY